MATSSVSASQRLRRAERGRVGEPAVERRSCADAVIAAHVVDLSHRRVVDRHERGHHDLHARVRSDAAGDDVVAGDADHSSRQHHRAAADDSQRARGHEIRRVVSGAVPRELRCEGRERPCDPARAGRVRMVRHSDMDRGGRVEHTHRRGVAGVERHGVRHLDIVRGVLARSGLDHSERARGHQETGRMVGAAPARRRRAVAWMGGCARRRTRPHPRAVVAAAAAERAVLAVVPRRGHSERRLLGDAQPQHSRFHPLRAQSALAGVRAGAWAARDDDRVRVHWRGGDERDDCAVRRSDLGSGRADRAHRQPGRRRVRRAHHHAGAIDDEHGGERGVAGKRFLEPRAEDGSAMSRAVSLPPPSAS